MRKQVSKARNASFEQEKEQGRTPPDKALAQILHARRLLNELLDLRVDGESDGRLEVSTGELVRDPVDDLDGVLVLGFAAVGAWIATVERESVTGVREGKRW